MVMLTRRAVLLSGLTVLVASACGNGGTKVTEHDIAGTWAGPGGASIAFSADLTFQATSISADVLPDQGAGPMSGQGRWRLKPAGDGSGLPTVDVMFLTPNAVNLPLEVDRKGGALVLFAWIGDPDDDKRYTLRHS